LENEVLTDDEIVIHEDAKETGGKNDNDIEEDENPFKIKDIDAIKAFETVVLSIKEHLL